MVWKITKKLYNKDSPLLELANKLFFKVPIGKIICREYTDFDLFWREKKRFYYYAERGMIPPIIIKQRRDSGRNMWILYLKKVGEIVKIDEEVKQDAEKQTTDAETNTDNRLQGQSNNP